MMKFKSIGQWIKIDNQNWILKRSVRYVYHPMDYPRDVVVITKNNLEYKIIDVPVSAVLRAIES